MTKSFYIILTAAASLIVLFLMGQWIGRSYSLTKEQLARQIHESFCHATERYQTNKTKNLPTLFREELDKYHLDKDRHFRFSGILPFYLNVKITLR